MLDEEERKIWQKKEDSEQIQYLKWYSELRQFQKAMLDMPRMKEEYRCARRICSGYKKEMQIGADLVDALNATFMLERRSVVTQPQVQAAADAYLNKTSKAFLASWQKEQGAIYSAESLSAKEKLSPLTIARVFARLAGRNARDAGFDITKPKIPAKDFAMFFGVQSEEKCWSPAVRHMFRTLAEEQTRKFLIENSKTGTLSKLVWKEMHDIIIKDKVTPEDEIRFGLIGTVGQRLGIDLEEILLAPKQKQVEDKPTIHSMLKKLRVEEKGRHSLLGRLGLRRVRSVRG